MEKTARKQWGNEAEERAVVYLRELGYFIRARNFYCPWGELDVVAEKDQLLCVVEVRMRSTVDWGGPAQTVMSAKQRRIVKATLHYLAEHTRGPRAVRFDVVSVVGRGDTAQVEHIANAFDAGF